VPLGKGCASTAGTVISLGAAAGALAVSSEAGGAGAEGAVAAGAVGSVATGSALGAGGALTGGGAAQAVSSARGNSLRFSSRPGRDFGIGSTAYQLSCPFGSLRSNAKGVALDAAARASRGPTIASSPDCRLPV